MANVLASERAKASSGRWDAHYAALMAEALGNTRRAVEGIDLVTEALARAERTECRYYQAELQRIKGELLLAQPTEDGDQAETCFQSALRVARAQSAKSLELRAAMSLSRLWQRQGKKTEARNLLAEVYGWFTEGFDTADLKQAKALLEEL
jgi:predicted ATPase